jgi:hypothetical protein
MTNGGIGLISAVFPLALPPFPDGFATITIAQHPQVSLSRSPFTGSRQVYEWPGDYLLAEVILPPLKRDMARAWVAWMSLLRGESGTFLLWDTSMRIPRGTVAGAPVVNGASQTGKTLMVRGFTPGAPLVLRSGDWIQIGDGYVVPARLYMNLLDVTADGSGNATLNLFPRLRESPADGSPLITNRACGTFALDLINSSKTKLGNVNCSSFTVDSAMTYGISFDAAEAF